MLKFATFQFTSVVLASNTMSRTAARKITAHRAVFDYEPKPGFLYVRSRAISSRCNDNFDEFPAEEIKKAYATFIGKPVFVNHHNDNHRRARGVIIDAALHEDRNPDGSPDTWSEVLMEVDAVRFPILAKAILAGHVDRTSMGTDVAYSICSACDNKASSPSEYCAHIPRMKGKRIYQVTSSATGTREGVLVREKCFGLKFFENSLLVEEPADPTAFFLGVDDRGMKMHAAMGAGATPEQVKEIQVQALLGISASEVKQARKVAATGHDHKSMDDLLGCRSCSEQIDHLAPPLSPQDHGEHGPWNLHGQCKQCGFTPHTESDDECDHPHCQSTGFEDGWHTKGEHIDPSHLDPGHPDYQSAEKSINDAFGGEDHSWLLDQHHTGPTHLSSREAEQPFESFLVHGAAKRKVSADEHYVGYTNRVGGIHAVHPDDYDAADPKNGGWATARCGTSVSVDHTGSEATKYADSYDTISCKRCQRSTGPLSSESSLVAEAASKAEDFFAANPPSVHHVVERFKSATPEQHDSGMNWYKDSHHIAKAIGHGDTAKAAGLMGVYSAGTPVAPNYHYASRSILHNTAVGGKVNPLPPEHSDFHGKPNASGLQAEQATRMLKGEHHSTVLTSPKVSNYAHLIEHGDNEPGRDAPERVVVDRHAVSAAIGRRITDSEFGSLNLSSTDNGKRIKGGGGAVHDYGDDKNSRYHHLANVYRQAAHVLRSEGHGDVKAHQVQAVAWGVQKSRNDAEDAAHVEANGPTSGNIKGRQISQDRQRDAWEKHHKDIHDELGAPANPRGHWGSKGSGWTPSQEDLADFTDHLSTIALGETKAPADVDTLRDEECPVCGETDSYDGNSCQVCGFDAPPQMFQDPNLDTAKSLDLRKDILQDAGTLPGAAQDGMTPGEQDANGGLPGAVPGEQVPGSDQVPVDPSNVDGDGNVTPTTDPSQVAQQQMEMLQSGQPITPDMLGPSGELLSAGVEQGLNPDAATGHFDQGGEAFTEGPNAPGVPGEPEGPEGPVSPDDLDEDGQMPGGEEEGPRPAEGDPGTPEDGVVDLQCPACGFSADAAQPTSTDMDDQALPDAGAGNMAGDVCPNCQQAQMMSVGEMEQMAGAPPRI